MSMKLKQLEITNQDKISELKDYNILTKVQTKELIEDHLVNASEIKINNWEIKNNVSGDEDYLAFYNNGEMVFLIDNNMTDIDRRRLTPHVCECCIEKKEREKKEAEEKAKKDEEQRILDLIKKLEDDKKDTCEDEKIIPFDIEKPKCKGLVKNVIYKSLNMLELILKFSEKSIHLLLEN